jgi:hypothetical protein
MWVRSAQLPLDPFPQSSAKVSGIDSEGLADRFKRERSLCVPVGNPCLNLGEPSTMGDRAARGASLKAPQGIDKDRQHQLFGAVKARVVTVFTRVPLLGRQNVRGYQFSEGVL